MWRDLERLSDRVPYEEKRLLTPVLRERTALTTQKVNYSVFMYSTERPTVE